MFILQTKNLSRFFLLFLSLSINLHFILFYGRFILIITQELEQTNGYKCTENKKYILATSFGKKQKKMRMNEIVVVFYCFKVIFITCNFNSILSFVFFAAQLVQCTNNKTLLGYSHFFPFFTS